MSTTSHIIDIYHSRTNKRYSDREWTRERATTNGFVRREWRYLPNDMLLQFRLTVHSVTSVASRSSVRLLFSRYWISLTVPRLLLHCIFFLSLLFTSSFSFYSTFTVDVPVLVNHSGLSDRHIYACLQRT